MHQLNSGGAKRFPVVAIFGPKIDHRAQLMSRCQFGRTGYRKTAAERHLVGKPLKIGLPVIHRGSHRSSILFFNNVVLPQSLTLMGTTKVDGGSGMHDATIS